MSKPIYTTRCTVIESFREWINCDDDAEDKFWISEENVIGNIKGIERSNVKADYGTAGHSIIENSARYKTETGYQVKDFVFTDVQAAPMLKYIESHPYMVREIAASKVYDINGVSLVVTGTIDGIEGLNVHDNKFKFSSFNMDDYMNSMQWRIYLDMIGLNNFHYDFFRVSKFDKMEDMEKAVIGECETMSLRSYPDMQKDIISVLTEFMDFVFFKGLEGYLTIDENKSKRILRGDVNLKKFISL